MRPMLMEWALTSALLILAVTVLRALLGRRISAGLRYALWAVVLVRLLVPLQFFSLPVPANLPEADREPITASAAPAAPVPDIQGEPVDAPVIAAPHPGGAAENDDVPGAAHPWDVLGWLWLAGAMVMSAAFLFSNLTFALRLRRVRVPLEDVDCPLPVYLAENLPSPCLFGLARPSVYVTAESAQNPAMLRHVLAHEYTHFRHGDYVWNLLRSAALAVHWWNPLVWLAVILNRRDCELACDEGTLKRLGDGERFAYGRTLLALITVKPGPGDLFRCATTMTGGRKSVFDRVACIARAPKRWLWAAVVAVLAAALACVCAFGQAEPAPSELSQPERVWSWGSSGDTPDKAGWDMEEWARENGIRYQFSQQDIDSAIEAAQAMLEEWAKEAWVVSFEVTDVYEARTETLHHWFMYFDRTSTLFEDWTQEDMQTRYIVIGADYTCEYDHTLTPLFDGRQQVAIALTRPAGGEWSVESTGPILWPVF